MDGLGRSSRPVCQGLPDLAGELCPALVQVHVDQLLAVIDTDLPNGLLRNKALQHFGIIVIREKIPHPHVRHVATEWTSPKLLLLIQQVKSDSSEREAGSASPLMARYRFSTKYV